MGDDRGRTDRSTDEEYEARRRERFGRLPGRVPDEEMVETAQPEPPHEEPEQPPVRREWG